MSWPSNQLATTLFKVGWFICRRRALDAWALRLLEIVEDQKLADNVVSIAQAAD